MVQQRQTTSTFNVDIELLLLLLLIDIQTGLMPNRLKLSIGSLTPIKTATFLPMIKHDLRDHNRNQVSVVPNQPHAVGSDHDDRSRLLQHDL